jgi:hypothetical protein
VFPTTSKISLSLTRGRDGKFPHSVVGVLGFVVDLREQHFDVVKGFDHSGVHGVHLLLQLFYGLFHVVQLLVAFLLV